MNNLIKAHRYYLICFKIHTPNDGGGGSEFNYDIL
jgi:hypothetical protein